MTEDLPQHDDATAGPRDAASLAVARDFFRRRRWRLVALGVAALLLLATGSAVAGVARGPEGHVEIAPLLERGGAWLVSALIFVGWLVGRFPMVAALALAGGAMRGGGGSYPRSGPARAAGTAASTDGATFRLALASGAAFLLSAVLLPAFDLIMLTAWGGVATVVFIVAQVAVYTSLTAFAGLWTRWDGWLALVLGAAAMGWHRLAEAGHAPTWPVLADLIAFLLPPQAALVAVEDAFPGIQPIPWSALAYALGYAATLLLATMVVVRRRGRRV